MTMQKEASNPERDSLGSEPHKQRSHLGSSLTDQEGAIRKLSASFYLPSKEHRLRSIAEIRLQDALSPVPFHRCDDVLEIRSTKPVTKPSIDSDEAASIITINVSGNRFQTYVSTLQLHPETLLGNAQKRQIYWNSKTQEYFFDRHRVCFEAILYYYQSDGRLRRPESVPLDTFLEEIKFFELGTEACAQVQKAENISKVEKIPMPRTLWRRYIWFYMEFPQHSLVARVINLLSIFFTALSCISLAVESLPAFADQWRDVCHQQMNGSPNNTMPSACPNQFATPFFIIQTICVVFFTIEFILRLISTPSYRRFVLSFFNWVDLGSIVPYYVFLAIQVIDPSLDLNTSTVFGIRLLRVLRFTRIFKIYLIFRRLKSLRVLSATIRESVVDFAVMITILALLAFLFGAATYFAEQGSNGDIFDSIPKATYWGIVTITGVGYGDMCPTSPLGRVITCLCALSGPATMGMLVSVLVDRYQRVYNRKLYVSEPEVEPVAFDNLVNPDDDTNSVFAVAKPSPKRAFSQTFSHSLASLQTKSKHMTSQLSSAKKPPKFHFLVSFTDQVHDKSVADEVVTVMKNKLTEAISNTDVNMDLKLIDHNNQELWAYSSLSSSSTYASEATAQTEVADLPVPNIQMF